MRKAIITGVTGQDGSYLAELLLDKGYEVHGMKRWMSQDNTRKIAHLLDKPDFKLHYGDSSDFGSVVRLLEEVQPCEFYNLAALSHVRVSFDMPVYSCQVTGMGAMNCLEAIRQVIPTCHYYQASSSEMFGSAPPPQNEGTPFHPRSPYACAKVFAYHATVNYREAYGIHASNGILFNHESPRRGENFVTRKITIGLNKIASAMLRGVPWEPLRLGNLDAQRDWGHAKDYVRAMWMMTNDAEPNDYVVATGQMYSVRDFLHEAFQHSGLPGTWTRYVTFDPALLRPSEVDALQGDPSKIYRCLGWSPEVQFPQLVQEMMRADRVP